MRRQAILKAARKLLGEVDTSELSLNELARRSGVSKPNIYRYFESREHVLLQVWIEEVRELGGALARLLEAVKPGDVDGVVGAIVAAFAAQPKLCELMSIVSSVLERNLSAESIAAAKRTLAELTLDIAGLLHARLPELSLVTCAWAANATATWVAGIWPAVHPPPAAKEALARPELEGMAVDFERDFTRYLRVIFAGLKQVDVVSVSASSLVKRDRK
ncbi:Transcriptional regulator, TetR family protein [Minicystis rosea]|nr:Transcriptional regulator, TetR family protein [Minicystis rosea]